MKNSNRLIGFILIFIMLASDKTFAASALKPKVTVNIEGYDKTILKEEVYAYNFKEAVDSALTKNNIEIIYTQNGSESFVFSINGIKNNIFGANDGWFGFVIRDDIIIKNNSYLKTSLDDNDIVTIYYGDKNNTQIISYVKAYSEKNLLNLELSGKYSENKKIVEKPVSNAKITFISPDNKRKILITNKTGKAYTKIFDLGIYEYFVNDQNEKRVPNAVKTESYFYFYGLNDYNSVSRGEAVAFLVNQLRMEKKVGNINFSDVKNYHIFYKEINIAVSNKLVSGYADNTFRPDDKINLLQMTILLSNILDNNNPSKEVTEGLENVPSWAKDKVSKVVSNQLLNNVKIDWNRNVTGDDLITIYNNIIKLK